MAIGPTGPDSGGIKPLLGFIGRRIAWRRTPQ
jgi:hypothetical protein